jgi:hypothetical protein
MTVLALMLLLMEPPRPSPPAEELAAAMALWDKATSAASQRDGAVTDALDSLARTTLDYGRVPRPVSRKDVEAWVAKHDTLMTTFRARLPGDRRALDRQAIACAAEPMAWSLSLDELRQVGGFVATEAGAKFWSLGFGRAEALTGCYEYVLRDKVVRTDEDLLSVGVTPPERPKPSPVFFD